MASAFVISPTPLAAATLAAARHAAVATEQDSAEVEAAGRVEQATTDAGPTLELIEAGWDGMAVGSTWTPLRLKVTGSAEDMRVLVEAITEINSRTSPVPLPAPMRYPTGAYGREMALPAGSSIDITLWVPAQASINARLSSAGETLAETAVPLEVTREGWPLIAVLADAPAVARTLAAIELPYQGLPVPLAVAELEADAIPASSERLEAVTTLVVQGTATAELTGSQRDAVRDWVHRGGHLVIAGGPGGIQATRVLPDGTLPLTFGNADASAAIDGLGEWLEATAAIPPRAPVATFRSAAAGFGTVLAGSAEAPLAWRATLGRGTVTVLAVDPGIEPLASWAGATALLRAALAPALDATAWAREPGMSGMMMRQAMRPSARLNEVASLLPPDAHPRWPVAAAILAAFAIAVGPALYLVLRLIDRRELSWIAVPAVAIGLSAGIYLWAVRARGNDVITNIVSYIEIDDDDGPARQSVTVAFHGPMHRDLTIPLGGDLLVRPGIDALSNIAIGSVITVSSGRPSVSAEPQPEPNVPFRLIDGADRRVRFNTGQYAARTLRFGGDLTAAPEVRAELTPDDGLLVGTVHNETGLTLEDAAVIVGRSVAQLGTLAPGQSAPVRLEPTPTRQETSWYEPLSQVVFGQPVRMPAAQRAYAAGAPDPRIVPNDPETQRRARFLDTTFEPFRRHLGGEQLPLTFIAYTRAPIIDETLLPAERTVHHLTLIRQRLDLVLPPGPFAVPAGLIPPDVVETPTPQNMSTSGNGQMMWIELSSGSLIYSFRPPLPAGARPETLRLTTEQIGTAPARPSPRGTAARSPRSARPRPAEIAGAADGGVFSVYDWHAAAWIPLPGGSEHWLEAAPYVSPDGEVRIRVADPGNPELRFLTPSLAIEGYADEGDPR